jgi:putative two-component system hydrogenase maturation factor HypX/HoxX
MFGSEYWTYLLPRRVGEGPAAGLTAPPFQPLGARRAAGMGLLDAALGESADRFRAGVRRYAQALARDPFRQLAAKRRKPLAD